MYHNVLYRLQIIFLLFSKSCLIGSWLSAFVLSYYLGYSSTLSCLLADVMKIEVTTRRKLDAYSLFMLIRLGCILSWFSGVTPIAEYLNKKIKLHIRFSIALKKTTSNIFYKPNFRLYVFFKWNYDLNWIELEIKCQLSMFLFTNFHCLFINSYL